MTMFWKSWILTYKPLIPSPGLRGKGGSAGKILDTMILHLWLPLIWYATWPCSEKVELWPFDPNPRVREVVGLQAKNLQPCCCIRDSLYFICNMTLLWKGWILTFWHTPRVSARKIFPTMMLHFVIPFNLMCNMTMFWKSRILTFWPLGSGGGGILTFQP